MFLCWYYSFETQSQCETPICEERWEGICPLGDVKKQVYCVCVFLSSTVHVSKVTASSNQKLSTDQTSEEEMCTRLESVAFAPI